MLLLTFFKTDTVCKFTRERIVSFEIFSSYLQLYVFFRNSQSYNRMFKTLSNDA